MGHQVPATVPHLVLRDPEDSLLVLVFFIEDFRSSNHFTIYHRLKQGCGSTFIFADPDLAVFLNADKIHLLYSELSSLPQFFV